MTGTLTTYRHGVHADKPDKGQGTVYVHKNTTLVLAADKQSVVSRLLFSSALIEF